MRAPCVSVRLAYGGREPGRRRMWGGRPSRRIYSKRRHKEGEDQMTEPGKENCNRNGADGCSNGAGWMVNGHWYCANHWTFRSKPVEPTLGEIDQIFRSGERQAVIDEDAGVDPESPECPYDITTIERHWWLRGYFYERRRLRLTKAVEEVTDLTRTFELQRKRERPWIERWRQETGKHDSVPDYGATLEWIMDKAEQAE